MNYSSIATVSFPNPTGINVNMMPFIMGDINSLPEHLKHYASIIEACNLPDFEIGKVGYLTITESEVSTKTSQRRGGVHVERHPDGRWGGWGGKTGGLYMASNMADTTAVFNRSISKPGIGGCCEHLRSKLGKARNLKAGELVWMTDECPHESLVPKTNGTRQFFRLVTSEVSKWYSQHSTPNPLVEIPNHVQIINANKFHDN